MSLPTPPEKVIPQPTLSWFPELDLGYYPVTEAPYDASYWDKYVKYANTDLGRRLTAARINWVDQWAHGSIIDVGIGSGQFIETRNGQKPGSTTGFDINPKAVEWLNERSLYCDPYAGEVSAVSFWDVIEHIHDPEPLLRNVKDYVFASIPTFTGPEHILRSKHFRKDEHCWYWTRKSFPSFMQKYGFRLIGHSDFETSLGREDIETFAFARVSESE